MSFSKMSPGQVVTDHFLLQLPGIDDGDAISVLDKDSWGLVS